MKVLSQTMAVLAALVCFASGFAPSNGILKSHYVFQSALLQMASNDEYSNSNVSYCTRQFAAVTLGLTITASNFFHGGMALAEIKSYNGFADYAKENQLQQSDVGCFMTKCGDQTKALLSNPRGIKGVACLGQCKGEQSCATRCFAGFGSDDLNSWLSCTIEDNDCVKVPRSIDTSAENVGYSTAVRNFDSKSLIGTWYKTYGLNPNYDLFDCQTNTFIAKESNPMELDMEIFFRLARPKESGGGFWENAVTEHMIVDSPVSGRTMHTEGKMYGLRFDENWFIIGESDGSGDVPAFKLVAYKGHTLQGNYEGSFVYSKEPLLPATAIPAVSAAAAKAGLDWDDYRRIDNSCPAGEPLNDVDAGTGTSTQEWVNLVIGEGGLIDWISPGWRGEYNK